LSIILFERSYREKSEKKISFKITEIHIQNQNRSNSARTEELFGTPGENFTEEADGIKTIKMRSTNHNVTQAPAPFLNTSFFIFLQHPY
jgi:hypothetical protein